MIGLETNLRGILCEIGLSQDEIAAAEAFNKAGKSDELQKYLRVRRCGLMEEMHRTQKKVDNLDYLLRQLKGGTVL